MKEIQKRMLLFLVGCIGVRLLLVFIAKYSSETIQHLLGIVALCISIGFMYFYISGARTTGPETFGDKIWWNDLRPVHAVLYLLFTIMVFTSMRKYAWIVLLIDVMIGLTAFIYFHYKNGDFTKVVS
jgi:hypothetical protein